MLAAAACSHFYRLYRLMSEFKFPELLHAVRTLGRWRGMRLPPALLGDRSMGQPLPACGRTGSLIAREKEHAGRYRSTAEQVVAGRADSRPKTGLLL